MTRYREVFLEGYRPSSAVSSHAAQRLSSSSPLLIQASKYWPPISAICLKSKGPKYTETLEDVKISSSSVRTRKLLEGCQWKNRGMTCKATLAHHLDHPARSSVNPSASFVSWALAVSRLARSAQWAKHQHSTPWRLCQEPTV